MTIIKVTKIKTFELFPENSATMEGIQVITQDFVNVLITRSENDDAAPVERRYKKGITILDFKVSDSLTGGFLFVHESELPQF